MGKKAQELVKVDGKKLVKELNKAYADEWQAYYAYWTASRLVSGKAAPAVAAALEKIAAEELEHAEELAGRITMLGGAPLLSPVAWAKECNCAYVAPPANGNVETIIKQVIEAERCAIDVYAKLAELTAAGKDPITYQLMLHILEEEEKHEEDFENLLR